MKENLLKNTEIFEQNIVKKYLVVVCNHRNCNDKKQIIEDWIILEWVYDLDYSFIFKFLCKIWRNRLNVELTKLMNDMFAG